MTRTLRPAGLLLAGALLAPLGAAQDSTSATACGSDAVAPWADAGAAFGSEQRNAYIVDLAPFATLWGTPLGIAPVARSSRSSSAFNTSLIDAQALSERLALDVPFASPSYQVWKGAGFGVNNDPALNAAPGTDTAPCVGSQAGFAFAETGTTDLGVSYDGIVGGVINLLPSNPSRLYVTRVLAASNSCDTAANLAQFGMGSVDETGLVHFRADGVGTTGGCGAATLSGNYWWQTRSLARNPAVRNVISGSFPGLADASDLMVLDAVNTHNTPGTIPASVTGGNAKVIGTNFLKQYVVDDVGGVPTAVTTHFGTGATDQRGNLSYSSDPFPALGGTHGVVAHLAKGTANPTDRINLFGVDANGLPVGKLAITLPAAVTDNSDGFVSLGSTEEFDHYHSQVAFQGGNGQVAVGVDQLGNLLVAAQVDHDAHSGNDWPINYIAVARVTPALAVSWTMAGYNAAVTGKEILSGPGGFPIAQMVSLDLVTGGLPLGPSVSAPMIDSVGNVYFLTALEVLGTGDFSTGLVRAVYDPASFSYELDLVLRTGDSFAGQNSDRDWLITFLDIADSNSVSSGTAWSGNISGQAHGGLSTAGLDTADARTLGGMVLSASVLYDVDDDGSFDSCFSSTTPGVDQPFNTLLYLGHRGWEELGAGLAGTGGLVPRLQGEGALLGGDLATISLSNGKPGTPTFLVIGLFPVFAPFKGGTLVPAFQFFLQLFPTDGLGNSVIAAPWPVGLPSCIDLYFQYVLPDAGAVKGYALSNGLHVRTP